MWDSFWADVVVAVIGAVMTVGIAYGTFALQQRHNEMRVLRHLIWDIEHRRALAIGIPVEIPHARALDDYKRANLSVVDMRDRVRYSVDQVRPNSKAHEGLSKMTAACHHYLEDSHSDPDFYAFFLRDLQLALQLAIQGLASEFRGIEFREPGSSAYIKRPQQQTTQP
ncbi:hypothetical protein ACIPY2_08730 [Paenarthrobacter sp. NPDC089675]|uniref:hypothetical protein n=1 Tax=Paenarthrobacter sp. NPDC089675 TaxID=3364376 RepID=UPI00382364C3